MAERTRSATVAMSTVAAVRDGQEALRTVMRINATPYGPGSPSIEAEFTPQQILQMLAGGISRIELSINGDLL